MKKILLALLVLQSVGLFAWELKINNDTSWQLEATADYALGRPVVIKVAPHSTGRHQSGAYCLKSVDLRAIAKGTGGEIKLIKHLDTGTNKGILSTGLGIRCGDQIVTVTEGGTAEKPELVTH